MHLKKRNPENFNLTEKDIVNSFIDFLKPFFHKSKNKESTLYEYISKVFFDVLPKEIFFKNKNIEERHTVLSKKHHTKEYEILSKEKTNPVTEIYYLNEDIQVIIGNYINNILMKDYKIEDLSDKNYINLSSRFDILLTFAKCGYYQKNNPTIRKRASTLQYYEKRTIHLPINNHYKPFF